MKNSLETNWASCLPGNHCRLGHRGNVGSTDWFHPVPRQRPFQHRQDSSPATASKWPASKSAASRISLYRSKVRVIMRIPRYALVKTDSKAPSITGLMGQNFVAGLRLARRTSQGRHRARHLRAADLASLMIKLDGAVDGIQGMTKAFASDDIHNLLAPRRFLQESPGRARRHHRQHHQHQRPDRLRPGTVGHLIYEDTLYSSASPPSPISRPPPPTPTT